jgi:hypothetical protein
MISKMKCRLFSSTSAFPLAVVLLAASFVFGASRAHAEYRDTTLCSPAAAVLEYGAEVAEELDVICQAMNVEVQILDTAELQAPALIEHPAAATSEIPQTVAEAAAPQAIEGQAIPVEITQTVTIAVLGQAEEQRDIADDITGSIPSTPAPIAATPSIIEPETAAPQPVE